MSEDPVTTIEYEISHVERMGIEIGFVAQYTDPSTGEERYAVADTYREAEDMIRLDIVKRFGIDAIVMEEDA